jgi:hypothetical protein
MDWLRLIVSLQEWWNKHQSALRRGGVTVFAVALGVSLLRVDWSSVDGLRLSIGPSNLTMLLVLVLCLPLLIGVLLIVGGKLKLGMLEVSMASIFQLVKDPATRDELFGILGFAAERAVQEGEGETAAAGERLRSALADIAKSSEITTRLDETLHTLARQYESVRRDNSHGVARIRAMTAVQTKIRGAVEGAVLTPEDVLRWLTAPEKNAGERIVGVTIAREQSDAAYFDALLGLIADSASAFEQYQALLAMERLVGKLTPEQRVQLKKALDEQRQRPDRLGRDNDRRRISDRLLAHLGAR